MDVPRNIFISIVFIATVLSVLAILLSFHTNTVSAQSNYIFEQEIDPPFDLSTISSPLRHQPIDIQIEFDNKCWAKNETIHSIQIGYINSNSFNEIESQIYNLKRCDNTHISSCRIVFLLPDSTNEETTFLVKYSDSAIDRKPYTDHLQVKKSHFHYEPISGQSIDFDYFSITQDGFIPYIISYKGTLFGNGISQVVARLDPQTTKLDTTSIDQFASFSMLVSIDEYEDQDYIGTSFSTDVKTSVLLDGNLLVKIKVDSISPEGLIKTSNVYSYYYCPDEPKRMNVEVTHEILETCEMGGSYALDGSYAYLLSFHSQSNAIERLNMGSILPRFYLYGEDNRVQSYEMPVNPTSAEQEMILDTFDDVDLGKDAWLCIHSPETKKTHGLLFAKNHSIANLNQDGLQVKSFVEETLKIPGLEVDTGSVYASRNHYDAGKDQQLVLKKGFTANLDVSFVTYQKGSWSDIANESEVFQSLIPFRKTTVEKDIDETKKEKTFSLSGRVTGVNSIPFGSILSAYTGKNFSYITAELYKDSSLVSSTVASRIPLRMVSSVDDTSSVKGLIQIARSLIDLKNTSILRTFHFSQIPTGNYVIKIYKEHPLFSSSRVLLGYHTISLTKDSTVTISCKRPVTLTVSTMNQHDKLLEDVMLQICSNDFVILETKTKDDEITQLSMPRYLNQDYNLNVYYKGIPVETIPLSFSLRHFFIPYHVDVTIPLYDFSVHILDEWNLPPSVTLQPRLLFGSENNQKEGFSALNKADGLYIFKDIPKESYTFSLTYKQFQYKQQITLDDTKNLDLLFPVTYESIINVYNRLGLSISDVSVSLTRNGKTQSFDLTGENLSVSLPPGKYQVQIKKDESVIAKQSILIFSDTIKHVLTNQHSILLNLGYFIVVSLLISSIAIGFLRKRYYQGFLLLFAGLILLSALSPWWILTGSSEEITTETTIHLLPTQMVTFTETMSSFSGEFHVLPAEASFALEILLILLILPFCILFSLQFISKKYKNICLGLYLLSTIILLAAITGFIYFVSQLTIIGVGSTMGSGIIEYTQVGMSYSVPLHASWGFGNGLYIGLFAVLTLFLYPFMMKRKTGSWKQIT